MPIPTRSRVWMPLLLLLGLATTAAATTTVPLNTGYDHSKFGPYPAPPGPTSQIQDNYWINIASYPPTNPPAPAASRVLQTPSSGWWQPFPATHWISAWPSVASPPGTSPQNPAYTIFRKCFCLLPNYKNASLSFRVRADDTIQVWVNTQLNVALAPTIGNWNSPTPWASKPSQPSWFRVGRNCIYVLVEDYHGFMGFDLVGSVQADGLMPLPAAGPQQQFQCPCESPTGIASARARASDEDQAVVQAILALAEKRRAERVIVRPDGQRP